MAALSALRSPQCSPDPQTPSSVHAALGSDDVLQCILGHVSLATGNMRHMLVCRRWAQHARRSQTALRLKKLLREGDKNAASELYERGELFSNLTELDVTTVKLMDSFIDLCGSSRKLKSLRIKRNEKNPGRTWRRRSDNKEKESSLLGEMMEIMDSRWNDSSADETYGRVLAENPGLQRLCLSHSFDALPDGLSVLHGLTELRTHYNSLSALKDILNVAVTLTRLEALHLHRSPRGWLNEELKHFLMGYVAPPGIVPETISRLQNLQEMSLDVYQQLPPTFSALGSLRTLTFSTNQEEMDAQVEALPNLQKLSITKSAILSAPIVPHSIRSLELNECLCLSLDSLQGLTALMGLQDLVIKRCDGIQQIPSFLCSRLRRLVMDGLTTLAGLSEGRDSLKYLELAPTPNVHLPTSGVVSLHQIASLTRLEELHVRKSITIRVIPSSWSRLVRLKKLTLYEILSLNMLGNGLTALTSLRTLCIQECPDILHIPEGLLDLNLDDESKKGLIELMEGIERLMP